MDVDSRADPGPAGEFLSQLDWEYLGIPREELAEGK